MSGVSKVLKVSGTHSAISGIASESSDNCAVVLLEAVQYDWARGSKVTETHSEAACWGSETTLGSLALDTH